MSDGIASGHAPPDLVGLLAGEVARDGTVAIGRHLKVCPSCTEELIDLAVAHAALTSAARADRDLALPPRVPSREHSAGGPSVWSEPVLDPEAAALPPLTLPAQSDEAPRQPRRWGVIMAVAAGVVALGALGAAVVAGDRSPGQPVVAQGSLQPLQAPSSATGTVTVLAGGATRHMIVRTRDLSTPSTDNFYEVWLFDPATQKMLPVGVLPPSGNGDYQVSAGLMAGYSAVDLSLQADDGNPAHSQTSVLRASLSL